MGIKQKTLLVVTMAAIGYLGYQVYELVYQDVSNRPAMVNQGLVSSAIAAPAKKAAQAAAIPQVQTSASKQAQHRPLQPGQKAYLRMVNQYELLKMKRRLLEEQAAVAAAQNRIATLNKKTRDIDASLSNAGSSRLRYQLSYLDNQRGRWSATLYKAGHYHEVNVGSMLSGGVKIVKINRHGVMFKDGSKYALLTFKGMMPVVRIKAAVVKAVRKRPTSRVNQHYNQDEMRLLNMNPHSYTIQLIGSYHREVVEKFALFNHLEKTAMQFYVNNRGRPWYMLLYGDYGSRAKAVQALWKLPPNLTPKRPWVRRIAGVKRDIRRRRHGV